MSIFESILAYLSNYYYKSIREDDLKLRASYWENDIKKNTKFTVSLTKAQKNELKKFYGNFNLPLEIKECFYISYLEKTGIFDKRFIPEDLFYCCIDTFYNNREMAKYFDNKCFYPRIFVNEKQLENVIFRMDNIWLDSNYHPINQDEIMRIIKSYDELVVKQATDTNSGDNISFIGKNEIYSEFCGATKSITGDIVVQKVFKQHSVLNQLYPNSVNSIRIITLRNEDNIKIYSCAYRVGTGKSRVDNGGQGGLIGGIDTYGNLKDVAYSYKTGTKYYEHPDTGIKFNSVTYPSYSQACEMAKRLHFMLPSFRLISWDIAIDQSGNPVLIEANIKRGGITIHQMTNGPLFGDDTEKILEEVFGKKQ